jgi:hypothetical protein
MLDKLKQMLGMDRVAITEETEALRKKLEDNIDHLTELLNETNDRTQRSEYLSAMSEYCSILTALVLFAVDENTEGGLFKMIKVVTEKNLKHGFRKVEKSCSEH